MTHPRPTVPYPNSFVSEQVDAVKMAESIKRAFVSQVFTVGQKAAVEYCGNNFLITVNSMLVENSPDGVRNSRGCMICLLYTSPSPRDRQKSRMPSSA